MMISSVAVKKFIPVTDFTTAYAIFPTIDHFGA